MCLCLIQVSLHDVQMASVDTWHRLGPVSEELGRRSWSSTKAGSSSPKREDLALLGIYVYIDYIIYICTYVSILYTRIVYIDIYICIEGFYIAESVVDVSCTL